MADEYEWNEHDYVELVEGERRRYAWVMERYGGRTQEEAQAEASAFYYYEDPGKECRGLVFDDERISRGEHPEIRRRGRSEALSANECGRPTNCPFPTAPWGEFPRGHQHDRQGRGRLNRPGVSGDFRKWVRQGQIDTGVRAGVGSEALAELKRLRRENAELKRANGILKAAFTQRTSVSTAREKCGCNRIGKGIGRPAAPSSA